MSSRKYPDRSGKDHSIEKPFADGKSTQRKPPARSSERNVLNFGPKLHPGSSNISDGRSPRPGPYRLGRKSVSNSSGSDASSYLRGPSKQQLELADSESSAMKSSKSSLSPNPFSYSIGEHWSPLRASDLESNAVESSISPIANLHPLGKRIRARANCNRPDPVWYTPTDQRGDPIGDSKLDQNGYSPSCSATALSHFSDEPDRRIHSLSVPPSPRSPRDRAGPALRRAASSSDGMEAEFVAMRSAERLKKARKGKARANLMTTLEDATVGQEM